MSSSSSDSTNEQKGQYPPRLFRWGILGAVAGAIGGSVLFIMVAPYFSAALDFHGTRNDLFSIGFFLLLPHFAISLLTGIAGGLLFSRLRSGWGSIGAIIGGLIIEISIGLIFASANLPYLFLPKFEVAGCISGPGRPFAHHFVVGDNFSEEDALKVGNFYGKKHSDEPLVIRFYCLEGYDTKAFGPEYMLYEYTRANKDSSPTISTSLNPSQPNQAKECK